MFKSAAKRFRAAIVLGVVAALTVGGVAAAQSGGSTHSRSAKRQGHGMHRQGPPPMGLPLKGLTYAELHVEHNEEAKIVRVDQGTVVSASESSITLSENDGSEVTIQIGEETQVMGKPGSEVSVEELEGKLVLVCGPSEGTAKRIIVEPAHHGGKSGEEAAGTGGGPRGPARHGRRGTGSRG